MTQADLDRNEIIDKDEVLKMARQAGFHEHDFPFKKFKFEAFAKLVAAAAASKEREACHALRQTLPNPHTNCQVSAHAYDMALVAYGEAIRARSNE